MLDMVKTAKKMKTSSTLLYISAALLLSTGSMLMMTVIWNVVRMGYYFQLTSLGLQLGAGVLLAGGAALCLPAGWLASLVAFHDRSTRLAITMILVSGMASCLLGLGLLAHLPLGRELSTHEPPPFLNASLTRAIMLFEDDYAINRALSNLQIELRCCGSESFTDWAVRGKALPASCCARPWAGRSLFSGGASGGAGAGAGGGDVCTTPVHAVGCARAAHLELRCHVYCVCVLAIFLLLALSVTVLLGSFSLTKTEMQAIERQTKLTAALVQTPHQLDGATLPQIHYFPIQTQI